MLEPTASDAPLLRVNIAGGTYSSSPSSSSSDGSRLGASTRTTPPSASNPLRITLSGEFEATAASSGHSGCFVREVDFGSDNPREREMPRKFLLSREADRFNNQDVILKLRERVGKTRLYQDYATHRFQLRRGITTDFDF